MRSPRSPPTCLRRRRACGPVGGYIVEHSIDATIVGGLQIGRRLLPPESLNELGIGLFLQDIGMLALPGRPWCRSRARSSPASGS